MAAMHANKVTTKPRSGPGKPNQKKSQFMNFSQGHSGTNIQCEPCLFSQGKTPEFTKMGEIHELFVLALSLVWFARAVVDLCRTRLGLLISARQVDSQDMVQNDNNNNELSLGGPLNGDRGGFC